MFGKIIDVYKTDLKSGPWPFSNFNFLENVLPTWSWKWCGGPTKPCPGFPTPQPYPPTLTRPIISEASHELPFPIADLLPPPPSAPPPAPCNSAPNCHSLLLCSKLKLFAKHVLAVREWFYMENSIKKFHFVFRNTSLYKVSFIAEKLWLYRNVFQLPPPAHIGEAKK